MVYEQNKFIIFVVCDTNLLKIYLFVLLVYVETKL